MIDLKKLREEMEQDKKKDSTWGATPSVVLELLDQLEAAQSFAARYQWLRDNCTRAGVIVDVGAGAEIFNTIDDAIDDAMASQS